MNLQDSDRELFLKLYHSLLIYVNNKHKIFENLQNPKDLFEKDLEDIEKLKDKLYSDPSQIDSFVLRTFPRRDWRSYRAGGTL